MAQMQSAQLSEAINSKKIQVKSLIFILKQLRLLSSSWSRAKVYESKDYTNAFYCSIFVKPTVWTCDCCFKKLCKNTLAITTTKILNETRIKSFQENKEMLE